MAKIPKTAKKVFEGIIYDVYHWEQEQFNGTFKTFEMIRHHDTVVIIPVVGDKLYIHKEEQPNEAPFIGFPAGRFNKDETDPIGVAKRELLEETGYSSDDIILLRSTEVNTIGTAEWTQHVVVFRNCRKFAEPTLDEGGEIVHETMLVSFDEFLEYTKRPDFRTGTLKDEITKSLSDEGYKEDFRKKIFGV